MRQPMVSSANASGFRELKITRNYTAMIPDNIMVYGGQYRGECNGEDADLISFVSWFKYQYPQYAELILHIPNESMKPVAGLVMDKKKGVLDGAPDIFIMTNPVLCMEAKRHDCTKSLCGTKSRQHFDRQMSVLSGFADKGHICAVCFGLQAMKQFVLDNLSKPE